MLAIHQLQLPVACAGEADSFRLEAEPPAESWAIVEGALPPGLALSSTTGWVSGTVGGSGLYPFLVEARRGEARGVRSLEIEVRADRFLEVRPAPLPQGRIHEPYSVQLRVESCPRMQLPIEWILISASIQGLQLSQAGLLSGTPEVSGSVSLTVRVRDARGATASKDLSVEILP